MIKGKYRKQREGWCSWEVRKVYGVRLWKVIRKDWDLVSNRISFLLGNRQSVRFWKDK